MHIPPALIQEVREHLKEMLEMDAFRRSNSPFSSNVVIVQKKDGTIRFCIDYRKLYQCTRKDAYATPRIDDTLHLLAGAKYFPKLDLKSGYWQVELKEEDKPKTAFQVWPLGFYECNGMPFGLCNAPATFQRLKERCMGLSGNHTTYVKCKPNEKTPKVKLIFDLSSKATHFGLPHMFLRNHWAI